MNPRFLSISIQLPLKTSQPLQISPYEENGTLPLFYSIIEYNCTLLTVTKGYRIVECVKCCGVTGDDKTN